MPAGRILITCAEIESQATEVVVLGAEDRKLAAMLVVVRAAVMGEISDYRKAGRIACDAFLNMRGQGVAGFKPCARCQRGQAEHLEHAPRLDELRGPSITIPAGAMAGGELAVPIGVRVSYFDPFAVVAALERNLQAIRWAKSPDPRPGPGPFAVVGFWPVTP